MAATDTAAYFNALRDRLAEAETVTTDDLDLGDYMPQVSGCHANVDEFVKRNPRYLTVRGWLIVNEWFFIKHSVVEDPQRRQLHDITPSHPGDRTPRPTGFLRHLGTSEEFCLLPNAFPG